MCISHQYALWNQNYVRIVQYFKHMYANRYLQQRIRIIRYTSEHVISALSTHKICHVSDTVAIVRGQQMSLTFFHNYEIILTVHDLYAPCNLSRVTC